MLKKSLKAIAFASTLAILFGISSSVEVGAETTYAMTTRNANVRSGASTSCSVIGELKEGEEVKILSSKDGWYKIQYDKDEKGWSNGQNLKKTNGTTSSYANIRSGASNEHKKLDNISKGENVVVLSSKDGWYKIQYNGNEVGWVYGEYIDTDVYLVKKTMTVKAYAYSGGGYTATGTKARYGTLAVDPSVIPYGTKIYIKELDKVFIAEDCGGGIKGKKVDIYMNSQSACNRWGVRTITLQILK